LQEELGLKLKEVARDMEHSLEIELPFLQRALGKPFSLVPLMVRDQSASVARGLGKALARMVSSDEALAGQSTILVASTDLSHFYPQQVAQELDGEMLRKVEAFDPAGVIDVEEQGKGFACGRGALAAVLWAAQELGADRARVLHHATSGDVTGDFDRVVGYGAAVVTRKAK
jgi:AmmeMemoRadiSam system protein B